MSNRHNRRSAEQGTGSHPRAACGFTLMELVIVLAIIGVILTTAITMGINMRKQRSLSQAADELVYQLQRAKLTAIKEFTPTSIIIDKNNNQRYFLDLNGTCDKTAEAKSISLDNATSHGVVFYDPDGLAADCVTFIPSGIATNQGRFYLKHKDKKVALKFRIQVSGAGGISKYLSTEESGGWYQPGEQRRAH